MESNLDTCAGVTVAQW